MSARDDARGTAWSRHPAWKVVSVCAALAAVAALDALLGPGVTVSVFYMAPVAAATHFYGRFYGMTVALASAWLWWADEHWGFVSAPSTPAALTWNALMGLGMFLLLVLVLARLRDKLEEERRLSNLKSRMLSLVSHEFNNGLTTIKLALMLLREEEEAPLSDRRRKFYDTIARNQESLSRAALNFLNEARLESGGFRLELRDVDISRLFETALERLAPLIEEKSLRVERDFPREPALLRGDGEALALVVTNLLSNAVKYTPPGGRVDLSIHPQPEDVLIEVSDSGIGLSAQEQKILLHEPFWRAPQARERAKGFGYGLSLTREILELHGSRLMIDSAPGRGTRFWFRLSQGLLPVPPRSREASGRTVAP